MLTTCFKYAVITCIFLLSNSSVQSQGSLQNKLDSFSVKFINAIRTQSRPRAFLISDKALFKAGETIWFNAFLLNSVSQKVSIQNKFLFVDLVNENDDVIKTVILDAAHQQLNSAILLPDSISTGYYWLRAYTRQMMEGDSDYCAVKSVYIFNTSNTKAHSKSEVSASDRIASMVFYPEGGSLITGANSNVAFRIADQAGNPIATEGFIKDNKDSVITHFVSNKSGLGTFSFFPSKYRKYKAFIKVGGKDLSYPLPAFNFKAAQLSIASQATGNHLMRVLLEDSIYSEDFTTYIIGISKDSVCFASIGKGQYEVAVAPEGLPHGMTTFYLFDNNFKYLSERSVYVKQNNIVVNVVTDKRNYDKRKRVTLDISVTDKNKIAVPALYSVAVVDSLFSDPSDRCNSSSVTSVVNEKVIDNASLAQLECLTNEELDAIMLLRNKSFQELSDNLVRRLPTEERDSLLHIEGVVLNDKDEPAPGKIVNLISKSGSGIFATDTTAYNGRFYFPTEDYPDSALFHLSVKNLNGKSQAMKIVPDKINFPIFKTPGRLKQYLPKELVASKIIYSYTTNESEASGREKLPPINIDAKRAANYDVSKRISTYSSIITSEQIPEGTSVGNAILGVAGMHLINGFLVVNGLTSLSAPTPGSEPLLLIDGQQAGLSGGSVATGESSPVIAYLNSLNSKEIDFIEILKGGEGANYGLRGGNGVILVNTARNRKSNPKTGNNNETLFYARGISKDALFPDIDYDNKNTSTVDNRSTIFWNGSVLSNQGTNKTFSFFTSDIPSVYKMIISGITVHGDIIYKTITFSSK